MLDLLYKYFMLPLFGCALLVAIATTQTNLLTENIDILTVTPYVLLVGIMVVSLFLLQTATFYQSAMFIAIYAAVQTHLQSSLDLEEVYATYVVINLYWPLVATFLHFSRNKPVISVLGVMSIGLISGIYLLPYILNELAALETLLNTIPNNLHTTLFESSSLPVWLLTTYILALAFIGSTFFVWPSHDKSILLTATGAILFMFMRLDISLISSMTFLGVGVILLIGLFRDSFELAYLDELTQIPGRKAMQKFMNGLGRKYSIAMLDVDHFKKFNDKHGHDVGDQVLMLVAAKINAVSGGGKAYRYGGEEFAIVFRNKTPEEALAHLEIVREIIAHYKIQLRSESRPDDDKVGQARRGKSASKSVSVTVSMGVAEKTGKQSPEEVMKAADVALYDAKRAGRNCIRTA